MNKTILSLFVIFIILGLFSTFANAKSIKSVKKVKKTDKSGCGCYARSITVCGIGKCATSRRCRSKYVDTCKTRCLAIKKCSAEIKEKCAAHKVGTTAFVACQRSTAAKHCVSKIVKGAKSCDCKRVSSALCGNRKTPEFVKCRDTAYENCKSSCKVKLPCHPNRRICISDSNCNCKSVARTQCASDANKDACYAKKLSCCQKKCRATSRCYRLNCKNAGFARCSQYTKTKCAKFSADAKQRKSCETQTVKRCRAFELATCHKARRLFKFRSQCDKFATFKCGKAAGAEKCQCFAKVRKICVDYKIKRRERTIRRFENCKKIAVRLCDEKNCKDAKVCYQTEAKRCVKREHRRKFIIPKDCVTKATKRCGGKTSGPCFTRFTRKCSDKWLGRYCENNAFVTCNANIPCMTQEIKTCRKKLPKCWRNRKVCNDKNTCTTDVCDPKLGCLNIPKTCNDNNACTKDICDPKRGCVHTAKDCNDGVACTVDTCDKKTGLCENKKVHSKCVSQEKCTTGICTDKGCVFNKDEKCKKVEIDDKCKEMCKPANACEKVDCIVDKDLKFTCKRTPKVCNKDKTCFEGACDIKTGNCKFNLKKECSKLRPCEKNVDCVAWGTTMKLADKCEEPLCDEKKGVCVAVALKDKSRCTPPPPPCVCKARNPCETAKCVSTKTGEVCQRVAISCDDKDACTVDRCDMRTGKCIHTFKRTADCQPCKKQNDCAAWGKRKNLGAVCKEAVCDAKLNKCVAQDAKDQTKCSPECVACKAGPCDLSASCVLDANKKPVCKRVAKACDDKNDCTVDFCDLKTGKCVHKAVKNFGCAPICKVENDCKAWAESLKLARECKTAICDETGACKIVKVNKQSECKPCVDTCKPRNKCETTFCAPGETCQYVAKTCDDGVKCTVDSCDLKTGVCVHKYVESKDCPTKPVCKVDNDCKAFAASLKLQESCKAAECDTNTNRCKIVTSDCPVITDDKCKLTCKANNACEDAICVPEGNTFKCKRTEVKCDDKCDCTVDTCDKDRGCVHNFKQSDKCQLCVTDVDCDDWNKKLDLAKKCKKAVCDTKTNKCHVVDTLQTCNVPPKCPQCVARNCETAVCVFNANGNPECKRTPTNCDDKDACTADFCDVKTNKCVHRAIAGKDCAPICKTTVDCKTWAITKKLADKCQEAVCDTVKGGCKVVDLKDKTRCTPPVCVCPAAKPCETVQCTFGADKLPVCKTTTKTCTDNNPCTVDTCDAKTGNCINTFKKTDKCEPCLKDDDCKAWSTSLKLEKSCMRAFCEKKTGSCESVKRPGKCVCDGCVPRSPCETADCVANAKNELECKYTHKCDDGKECTRDYCDLKKNVCVNEFVKSKTCTVPCVNDNECLKMATEQKLADKCETSFCNKKTGSCEVVPVADKTCVPPTICVKECKPANACETVGCKYNELKQVICSRVVKDCNDKKECTIDSCDAKSGLCENKFVTNEKCILPCVSNADCVKWGVEQDLAKTCQVPVCIKETGSCKAVKSEDKDCKVPEDICRKSCPTANACETMTCVFDNNKAVCSVAPVKKNCDDKKACTKDSCDPKLGCVNEFIRGDGCTVPCEKTDECIAWGKKEKLADKCEEAFCDVKTGSCASMKSVNQDCSSTEIKKKCELECTPANGCELTKCIATKDSFRCERTLVPCDDGKECTKDSCDVKTGKCVNIFNESAKCVKPCEKDLECNSWAQVQKLSEKCQQAVCNKQTGSCEAAPMKDDSTCTTSKDKCELSCKAKDACDVAECVKSGNSFTCKHTAKVCDDFKICTADSCDAKLGCRHTFKVSDVCPPTSTICEQNLDCKSWGVANKLFEKCEEPVCDEKLGICKAVASSDTTRCKPTICNTDADCPQPKHGAVCEKVNGEKRCIPNECTFQSDCPDLPIDAKTIRTCTRKESSSQKICKETPKCINNTMCDDNNPCTTDICWTEYGYCHNVQKCDDQNECTEDISIADKATKTCKCANIPKVCTTDISLVTLPFNLVTDAQKSAWLGKCIKEEGCKTCVKNEQCDDNNGCTADSCEKQFCIHKPIHNEWCDPKVQGQPINFQSIPGLRDKLKIAGYDLDKLMPK